MAAKEDLRLLGVQVSPFAVRVHMALNMKGVNYEYVEDDLFDKSELLLRSNPVHKKVPVLIHDGRPVCESLVIVQYVDEAFPGQAILPADPYERAVARFWAAYVDDKVYPALAGIVMAATEEERAEKVKETLAAVEHLEEAFAKCSKGKAFFGGDSIGYLDLALGSLLFWFEAVRRMYDAEIVNAGSTPLLAAWAERFGGSAAAREVVPEADHAVQYAKKLQLLLRLTIRRINMGCTSVPRCIRVLSNGGHFLCYPHRAAAIHGVSSSMDQLDLLHPLYS